MFKHLFGPSLGLDSSLFCIFLTFSHNRSQVQTANNGQICVEVRTKLFRLKFDVIYLAKQALLSSQQTRNDYLELLELTVLYLGVIGYSITLGTNYGPWSDTQYNFGRPSCVGEQLLSLPKLYCVKIWLFKQQFRLTALQMLCNPQICFQNSEKITTNLSHDRQQYGRVPHKKLRFIFKCHPTDHVVEYIGHSVYVEFFSFGLRDVVNLSTTFFIHLFYVFYFWDQSFLHLWWLG